MKKLLIIIGLVALGKASIARTTVFLQTINSNNLRSVRPNNAAALPGDGKMPAKPANIYSSVARQLALGKRKDVADHQKIGGVKVWINRISLAGNKLFFRLDIRNKSKLPFDVDFVRFYIRDLKTVARMATHEQEILPVFSTLHKKTSIIHRQEIARVFGFKRFSLSEDQALNIEIYERNGNRNIYLQIRQNDLDDLKILQPTPQQPLNNTAAVNSL